MSGGRGTNRLIGARVRRREDPKFLRGRGQYASDQLRPGMLHLAFFAATCHTPISARSRPKPRSRSTG